MGEAKGKCFGITDVENCEFQAGYEENRLFIHYL